MIESSQISELITKTKEQIAAGVENQPVGFGMTPVTTQSHAAVETHLRNTLGTFIFLLIITHNTTNSTNILP